MTAAQQASGGATDAVFSSHAEDNEVGVGIEGGRTCGIESREERIRIWIVEHVECVFL